MPKVLIVTSSYEPTMIADMQRARHLAWELPELGWDVEILTPDVTFQPSSCIDDDSAGFFRQGVQVHDVAPAYPGVFDAVGMKATGWRALYPMRRAGEELLESKRFDMVYISTAQFPLFLLGPAWLRKMSVPFVLDFHDPCFRDGAFYATWMRSGIKGAISTMLAKHIESRSTLAAAGLISVSQVYLDKLSQRYADQKPAWSGENRHAVIPFAVSPRDLEEAAIGLNKPIANDSPLANIVYVGAGGWIMARGFAILCKALQHLRSARPGLIEQVRIGLFGTILGWCEGDRRELEDIAGQYGLRGIVTETPSRIKYRESVELLLRSDGALILGVDDAGYMPSKLFSYALSGKPLLAPVRSDGPAYACLKSNPELGHNLWFDRIDDMPVTEAADVVEAFLREVIARRTFERKAVLERYFASTMAKRHVELFDACL